MDIKTIKVGMVVEFIDPKSRSYRVHRVHKINYKLNKITTLDAVGTHWHFGVENIKKVIKNVKN